MNKKIKFILKMCLMKLRKFHLRIKGVKFGKNLKIWGKIRVEGNPDNISIGDNCSFNHGIILEAGKKIFIGNNVTLSAYSQIHTSYLDINKWPKKKHKRKQVVIGNNVWIASNVIVNAGTVINDNVIIGANSFVSKTLLSNKFYAGNPAKIIKTIIINK